MARVIDELNSVIDSYREVIRKSDLFGKTIECLQSYNISKIRCLALGSFAEEFPAKYQLALLLEILDNINTIKEVSLYDPVFNEVDKLFIKEQSNWHIVEQEHYQDTGNCGETLFYMPHAPLDLTEEVIKREKPKLILGNEMSQHTDRYTEKQLYDKYPLLSKLVYGSKNYSKVSNPKINVSAEGDGFVRQESKKSRRRKNKWHIEPTVIDYSSVPSYFADGLIMITNYKSSSTSEDGENTTVDLIKKGQEQWNHSFSDLSLFEIA